MSGRTARDRWRTPAADGQHLFDPAWEEMPAAFDENVALRGDWRGELLGRDVQELTAAARAEALDAALQYTGSYRPTPRLMTPRRVVMAGHQPQLFHPGVWVKNAALDRLARRVEATPLNLVIDNDTAVSAAIRLPTESASHPTVTTVEFDRASSATPWEEREILDPECFRTFGERATSALRPLVPDPILPEFWPLAVARSRHTARLGACLAQARHQWEAQWGLETLELTQSAVCDLPSFGWFLATLLARRHEFRQVHNQALHAYRQRHRVRSRRHPAPELIASGDWCEIPCWIWRAAGAGATPPRRRPLLVREAGQRLEYTDQHGLAGFWPDPARQGVRALLEAWAESRAGGIKIRTRALTTTLWARLALGDLFLHGIGGAKYDELTDELVQRFLGLQPPRYGVVSGTLRLPIDRPPFDPEQGRRWQQRLRELTWNPERALRDPPAAAGPWIELKRRWLAVERRTAEAAARHRALQQANAALQAFAQQERQSLLQQRQAWEAQRLAEGALASREYPFVLFPAQRLRGFMLAFQ